jgi:hypothetical protein
VAAVARRTGLQPPDDHGREAVTIRDLTVNRNGRSVWLQSTIPARATVAHNAIFYSLVNHCGAASDQMARWLPRT